MDGLNLLCDPLPNAESVQFKFVCALVRVLRKKFALKVVSSYIGMAQYSKLVELGAQVADLRSSEFVLPSIWPLFRDTPPSESMVWLESWFREAMCGLNSKHFKAHTCENITINISSTIAAPANLWWYQGPPLDIAIRAMQGTNLIARTAGSALIPIISRLESRLLRRIRAMSVRAVANSPWVQEVLHNRGIPMDGFVPSFPDLPESAIHSGANRSTPYILMYIGKETEPVDIKRLVSAGVKIVTFGAKRIIGDSLYVNSMREVDNRGWVSDYELGSLYANAVFTMFPFTQEGLGWVPFESMAHGTPVLTYRRQGPGYTVLDGKTGWLADSAEELVESCVRIWNQRDTRINPEDCIQRASQLSLDRQISTIISFLQPRSSKSGSGVQT